MGFSWFENVIWQYVRTRITSDSATLTERENRAYVNSLFTLVYVGNPNLVDVYRQRKVPATLLCPSRSGGTDLVELSFTKSVFPPGRRPRPGRPFRRVRRCCFPFERRWKPVDAVGKRRSAKILAGTLSYSRTPGYLY